jgi:nucleotide-binding universal stress UspA family protein
MSQAHSSIGTILVGVDGSEGSAAALRWACRLALAAGAEVVAVHVLDPSTEDVRPLGLPRAVLNEADWREPVQAELEGTWCAPLARAGVRHRTRVEEGKAGPCLAALAREEHADLLVTGHRGLSGLAELVHGSVSAYLTHHSPCPVAVVPAEHQAA